ncbi:hypothetical protein GINT2_000574 [Glugoides intestinalis]
METMVSSSNNTQKEIFVWQDLVSSNQPGGLLSTALFIEMSIAILFIITWLKEKEKEKEKEEKYYYNNLLNGFLTILLTIISGFISGKGFEIFFRTLHIICSGAYGNVVFSLKDIFISLLFGCIFVIFGSLLLFNKKLREQLRLLPVDAVKGAALVNELEETEAALVVIQQLNGNAELQTHKDSQPKALMYNLQTREYTVANKETANEKQTREDAEHQKRLDKLKLILDKLNQFDKAELQKRLASAKVMMANNKEKLVLRLKAMMDYLELKMEGKPEGTVSKLHKIWSEFDKKVSKVYEIGIEIYKTRNYLDKIEAEPGPYVEAKLKKKGESIVELTSNLSEKLPSSKLNDARLDEIVAGLDEIVIGFEQVKEILTNFKTVRIRADRKRVAKIRADRKRASS